MATLTFQGYYGVGPTWTDLTGGQLVGFYGATYDTKVVVNSYQSSTHISGAGGDVCTTNHLPNVKYVDDTHFNAGTVLSDANLPITGCTLRIHLNETGSIVTQNGRLYCYNGTTTTTYASGVKMYAFERGVTGTSWTKINDSGATYGGDTAGQRLNLADKSVGGTDHYWYIALSATPLSVGAKTSLALGCSVEYY